MFLKPHLINEILKEYNITFLEFIRLFVIVQNYNLTNTEKSLVNKGIGFFNKNQKFCIKNKEHILLNRIISDYRKAMKAEKKNSIINSKFIEYAEEMQKLFPTGTRPNCSVQWRGNKLIIAKKLTTLNKDFDIEFTKEQALDATRRYVDSFNGDYTYMECLEYFILRLRPEFKSNFLSYLENTEESNNNNNDFCELR